MDERLEIGDRLMPKECDFVHPILNRPNSHRQRRQVSSYCDLRGDFDLEKIAKNLNSRNKRRSKPQHCPSCECQSITDHSPIARLSDTPRCKNPEKVSSTLNQRGNYSTSKVASFPMRNSHVEQRHRQHRYSRPGISTRHIQNRNNLENSTISYRSRKDQKIEKPELSTIDSHPDTFTHQNQNRNKFENKPISRRSRKDQIGKIDSNHCEFFNSELETEQTDFRLANERNDFGQFRKDRQPRPDAIEEKSVGEIDRSVDQRCQDYSESKQRHLQRVSVRDDCRVDETEAWMENRSTDTRDDWLYDRDQRELEDLHEAVRQLVKLRNSGWNKQDRKQTERRDDSRETLERINRLVNKLPITRQKKANRDATMSSREENQSRKNKSIQQLRERTSKSDERKKPLASGQSRRMAGPSIGDCEKVGKSLEDELFDIELESLRRVEDNEDAASETEEEARELASKEMKKCRYERESNKISWEMKLSKKNREDPRGGGGGGVTNEYKDEKEKIDLEKKFSVQRKDICALDNFKGKKYKKEFKENEEESKQLSETIPNCDDESDFELLTYQDEFADPKNTHNWEGKGTIKNRMDEKIQGESKRHSYRPRYSLKEPELERSKARNPIDDTINIGLSRESDWRNSGTVHRQSFNATDCHYDANPQKQVFAERLNSNESIKTKEQNQIPHAVRRESKKNFAEPIRGDCCIESRKSCDYARKLKNRRLEYLNHMRNDLGKLFELEKCTDLPSPGRHASLPIVTTDINAINDR